MPSTFDYGNTLGTRTTLTAAPLNSLGVNTLSTVISYDNTFGAAGNAAEQAVIDIALAAFNPTSGTVILIGNPRANGSAITADATTALAQAGAGVLRRAYPVTLTGSSVKTITDVIPLLSPTIWDFYILNATNAAFAGSGHVFGIQPYRYYGT
jgi:hypothetical protein